ncbi:MAG: hypothetical protein ACI30O_06385 [Muribaculaceae bacterium]
MKRIIYIFTVLLVSLLPLTAHAEWYNKITFVVGSNASTPITVRYGGKTYKVYSSTTINTTGNTYTPSATDANGNSMKYEFDSRTESRGSNKYHTYVYTFYPRSNYSSGNTGSGYNSGTRGNSGSNDSWSDTGRKIGQGLADLTSTRSFTEGGAYPGLHANLGISKGFGEFCRIRLAASGFQVYGGVGKDWFFNGDNKDKFLWHAGFGGYVSLGEDYARWGDVSFGLTVAENAAWENLSLTFDVGFNYWFGRWKRVGVFTGAGIGWGDIKDLGKEGHHTKTAWNLELGIAFRLAKF